MAITLPAKSELSKLGWAVYSTSLYTQASPLVIAQGATADVIIDGLGSPTIRTYLPEGVADLVDTSTGKIMPVALGGGHGFTFSFKGSSSSNSGSATQSVNIGGAFGQIFKRNFRYPRGTSVEHNFTYTTIGYSLGTFIANGGIIQIASDTGISSIWDFQVQVHVLSSP